MTRTIFLAAALAALACGRVKERGECAGSGDCPVGEYCAHTPEGSVCWPDAVPPEVTAVTVACGGTGCVRDGKLLVVASAADDVEVYAVEATVDFDPAHRFPLTLDSLGEWSGLVDLATLDFPALEREAVVTVRVLDGARNEVTVVAGALQRPVVTRVRWAYASSGALTPAAIAPDGTVVIGRSDTANQLLAVRADGTKAWSLSVGSGTVTNAPSIGAEAIWVAANDGTLHGVKLDGSGELAGRTCTGSGAAKGPPAVLSAAGVDVAFGAFASTQLVASTASSCAFSPIRDTYSAGATVDLAGNVLGVTDKAGTGSVRRFSFAGAAFEELWTAATGGTIEAPPAFDALGRIVTGGVDGGLDRTTAAGATAPLATLGGSVSDSPIVLSNGDLVVGDAGGKLHRIAPDGTAVWAMPVDLGTSAVHAPMALTGGRLLVATADGKVHALDGDGTIRWAGTLAAGVSLGAGNLHTPAGSPFSTAYFGGGDGKLYAVIVEGALDTTAPWPKAWHDARNTSRAGGPF